VEFSELPEYLIFSFNRYKFDEGYQLKTLEKIELEYEITIPLSNNEEESFELYALIVHLVFVYYY
jgi:hypothetical protein